MLPILKYIYLIDQLIIIMNFTLYLCCVYDGLVSYISIVIDDVYKLKN